MRNPDLPLKGGVHGKKAVINRPLVFVVNHLDDAEALVARVEQMAVALLALAQRVLGALALRDVVEAVHHARDFPQAILQRDNVDDEGWRGSRRSRPSP